MKSAEAEAQFKAWLKSNFYAKGTIESYVPVVPAFFAYLTDHPEIKALPHAKRVEEFLSWRVVEHDISPSTQGVELTALIHFHHMLGIELTGINALRAKRRDRIPPILTKEQVKILIDNFPHDLRLVPMILYGCAMRINECLRLRIKDIDLSLEKFAIHEAKGNKERLVPIPHSLIPLVKVQYDKAIAQWKIDRHHNFNGVNCGGIEKKYPAYPVSQDWYWLFPAEGLSTNPETQVPMMRHHVMDWTIQRIAKDVRSRCELPIYTTPHSLRHACLTHMAADMISKGFTETMIEAELKKLSGHVQEETLRGYIHLAAPKNAFVVSPIEGLV